MGGSALREPLAFARAKDWGDWLAKNHATAPEVWLRLAKKGTGLASIDWEQAVEQALVWGWIDGLKRTESATHWLQRFTPRKARSAWSEKNRATAERLIAAGLMQPAGLAAVEAARADGRWAAAYAGPKDATLPPDFIAAVAASPQAQATLAGYDARNRYALYYRLASAKRPETRAKRIAEFVALLERGERIHPARKQGEGDPS